MGWLLDLQPRGGGFKSQCELNFFFGLWLMVLPFCTAFGSWIRWGCDLQGTCGPCEGPPTAKSPPGQPAAGHRPEGPSWTQQASKCHKNVTSTPRDAPRTTLVDVAPYGYINGWLLVHPAPNQPRAVVVGQGETEGSLKSSWTAQRGNGKCSDREKTAHPKLARSRPIWDAVKTVLHTGNWP